MAEKQTMMITTALAIVVVVAIAVMIYVNLPSEKQEEKDKLPPNVTLTLIYGDQELTYNLSTLTKFEQYTNSGRYIKTKLLPDSVILGNFYNYTGVKVQTLLEEFDELPENFTINVTTGDEYVTEYFMNDVLGYTDVYDENGTIIDNETAVMLLAYMENGSYYSDIDPNNEIGPFRIVFVGDNRPITSSALWSKKVISIEVRAVQ